MEKVRFDSAAPLYQLFETSYEPYVVMRTTASGLCPCGYNTDWIIRARDLPYSFEARVCGPACKNYEGRGTPHER